MACPQCGGRMKFQRSRPRPVISVMGRWRYERAYYCATCKLGYAPVDESLAVGAREVSPRRQRVIRFLSGHLSFPVVGQTLPESYELTVNEEPICQVVEEIGQEARAEEDQQRQ